MSRALLATACAVVLSLTSTLQAQSLAAAAKKAEEQSTKAKQEQSPDKKKDDKPQTKVYTNKDLADVPPPMAAAPSETAAAPVGGSAPGPAAPADGHDEARWRSRATALRRTLADDQTKLAAAKAHYDSLPDTAKGPLGAPVVEAWMKAREEITRLTAVVANDQRALSDFEEEARKAGVLPGWIRDK